MKDDIISEKQRSAAYPAATMESCLDVLNALKSLNGKNCSYETLAAKMGVSVTTYSFKAKVSSSKQYGFIENLRNVIQLSERGRALIYPTQTVNEKEILLECFQNPALYGKIIQNFLGKPLPSTDKLANELMKSSYGIKASGKDLAAECFIKNAEYVGALQNGILSFDNVLDIKTSSPQEEVEEDFASVQGTVVSDESCTSYSKKPITQGQLTSGYRFQIPMLSGKSAELYLPDDISDADISFFEQSITFMLPLFLKNLRDRMADKNIDE